MRPSGAIGLEVLEGQFALHFGLRADSVDAALFGMHDGADPLGEQGTRDRLERIVVGVLRFLKPQLAGIRSRDGGRRAHPAAGVWSRRRPDRDRG